MGEASKMGPCPRCRERGFVVKRWTWHIHTDGHRLPRMVELCCTKCGFEQILEFTRVRY